MSDDETAVHTPHHGVGQGGAHRRHGWHPGRAPTISSCSTSRLQGRGRTASAAKVTCPANPRNICLETLEAETFQSGGYVVAASRVLSRGRDG